MSSSRKKLNCVVMNKVAITDVTFSSAVNVGSYDNYSVHVNEPLGTLVADITIWVSLDGVNYVTMPGGSTAHLTATGLPQNVFNVGNVAVEWIKIRVLYNSGSGAVTATIVAKGA